MKGTNVGKLSIIREEGSRDDIWRLSGHQGDGWLYGQVSFYESSRYWVRFCVESLLCQIELLHV